MPPRKEAFDYYYLLYEKVLFCTPDIATANTWLSSIFFCVTICNCYPKYIHGVVVVQNQLVFLAARKIFPVVIVFSTHTCERGSD